MTLTDSLTHRELIFCRMSFSLSTMLSPLRFLTRFFSSFLQAYILPVALVWQAHTLTMIGVTY